MSLSIYGVLVPGTAMDTKIHEYPSSFVKWCSTFSFPCPQVLFLGGGLFYFFKFIYFFIKVWLIYHVVPISAIQQSDPIPQVLKALSQSKLRQNSIHGLLNPWVLNPRVWKVNCILSYFLRAPPLQHQLDQ